MTVVGRSEPEPKSGLQLELVHAHCVCYAMQQNGLPPIQLLRLTNGTGQALRELEVHVAMLPDLAVGRSHRIAALPPGASCQLTEIGLDLRPEVLLATRERQRGTLRVTVEEDGRVLLQAERPIDVLAFAEWPGTRSVASLLAAFVMPNNPSVPTVLRDAARRLGEATGDPALDGYQSRDPLRARAIAAAVFYALQARQLVYSNPPASFEASGQKVRAPDQVIGEGMGTCLDLAVLYAACLEQVGLHPVVLVVEGHALAGAWLVEETFADPAPADALPLRKRIELDMMIAVECTAVCSGRQLPFADATVAGAGALASDGRFLFAVDVRAARRAGILPLPLAPEYEREPDGGPGEAFPAPEPGGSDAAGPGRVAGLPAASAEDARPEATLNRMQRWQRRLLDLSLRNRLLNFRPGKRSLPLIVNDLARWEAELQEGRMFHLAPRPASTEAEDSTKGPPARRLDEGALRLVEEGLERRRLYFDLQAEHLDARLLEIHRRTRSAQEEAGVSTLYLAMGFLRWYETSSSRQPRRAPLLLVPLEIQRRSVKEGFRLAMRDDEVRVNETLLQKLEQDFGMRVDGFERTTEQDVEDDGLSVASVLDRFRRAVVDIDRWEVETDCQVSNFSFAKHLMWRDLEELRPRVPEHPLLRHLVESPGAAFDDGGEAWPEPDELDDQDPVEHLCPLDADSSQLCAVTAAVAGRTFVLEGPPGTGKSQTISNLIAQAIGSGRRVLFVAEKRAALEVVQRRLAAIGLGPFCLELHSGKGSKRQVVEQLGQALSLVGSQAPGGWRETAQALQRARETVNAHAEVIHRRRANGMSVYQATSQLIGLSAAPFVRGVPTDGDAAMLADRRGVVADLARSAAVLGDLPAHPWHGVRRQDWSPMVGREVAGLVDALEVEVAALRLRLFELDAVLDVETPATALSRASLVVLLQLLDTLGEGMPIGPLLVHGSFDGARRRLEEWIQLRRLRAERFEQVAEAFDERLLCLDLDSVQQQLARARGRSFLWRWWCLRRARRPLAAVTRKGVVPPGEGLDEILAAAQETVRLDARLRTVEAELTGLLAENDQGAVADLAEFERALARTVQVRRLAEVLHEGAEGGPQQLLSALVEVDIRALQTCIAEVGTAFEALQRVLGDLDEALQIDVDLVFGAAQEPDYLDRVERRITGWRDAPGALRDQCAMQRDVARARELGLAVLSSSLLGGDLQAEQLGIAFERSHLEEWLHVVMRREPALAAFRGLEHGAAIQRFRSLDEELIELAGAVLRARLAAELPTVRSTSASSSELGVLLRELKKQRRHLAPRQLFQRIPNLLSRLAPCCLMSPMSVAQVLGPRSEPFDLVVFDEASQVPVWDAVGAIARGRSLVVVGDSKQLPPTTFFQRLDEGDDESVDDGQVEELESVLDECAAAGLRRLSLRWHYRSQHESLIAFSNHHYYDNRLLTFPSPDRDEAGEGPTDRGRLGVRLQMVEGVYDRSRSQTNRVEAECLVRDLVARLSDPSQHDLSFGVVTFSVVQQVLVEDLLDEARRDHPEIEHAFAGCDEPVFVKNLENVQGDERDVMLFSVCYGPDSAGRVHMNFGPLNRQGGERRLNVAITRARRELVVYSSVHADQIELSRTNSIGVRHLRAFLDYCRRGPLVLDEEVVLGRTQAPESPFEREVLAAIESLGHEVHAQVGCSGYRIDLAVVDPRRKGRYLLGVECDGATYHSAATARDRDRLRQAVLERLGWRIERVWSTDWWMDPRAEVRRLADVIERLLREPIAAPPAAPPAAPTEPDPSPAIQPAERGPIGLEVESGAATEFERYTACELPRSTDAGAFHATVHSRRLAEQAEQVLASETPIVFDLLARRLCEAWGVGRMTERVRSRVERILQLVDHREHDGALWAPGVDPAGWRGFRASQPGNADREAEQLPSVEIVNAMVWVLEQHGSLSEEDLMREAARVFGITRLGRAVRAVMQHAMRRLLRDGAGILEAGLVRLRPTAEDDD